MSAMSGNGQKDKQNFKNDPIKKIMQVNNRTA